MPDKPKPPNNNAKAIDRWDDEGGAPSGGRSRLKRPRDSIRAVTRLTGASKKAVKYRVEGNPDPKHVSTSYAERQNLNVRMHTRRLWTRLRLGSSRDVLEVKGGNRRATSWGWVMRVKIFDLSWNVDLNRLENEINVFLASLPSNAVKHVQSAASSTRTGDTDQMQTDYLVTVWYEGEPKKSAAKKSARR